MSRNDRWEEEAEEQQERQYEDQPAERVERQHEVEVHPNDSASRVSSTSSAKKLKRAEILKKKQEIEIKEQKLRHEREQLELMMSSGESGSDGESEVQFRRGPLTSEWQPLPQHPLVPPHQPRIQSAVAKDDTQHEQLLAALHLPHAEMMSFSGDPLEYWTFIRSFENSVERICHDDGSKLTRLLQYCKGKAKKVIQCCAIMSPSQGYAHARKLLSERFGNEYRITEAWVEKVTSGSQIRSHESESLRNLADDLKSCEATLTAMNCVNEVSTQRVLVQIVGRLPHYLQMRWMREIHVVRNKQNRLAEFRDLVLFIDRAAEEITDPVYSKLLTAGREPARTQQFPRREAKAVSANTSASSAQGQTSGCVMCTGLHGLAYCEQFKRLNVDSRARFCRQNGLCFNCLRRGHKSDACTLTKRCPVFGCGRKHSQFLHRSPVADVQPRPPTERPVEGEVELRCMSTGAGVVKTALPLVPVVAWSEDGTRSVPTFALLDSGSTTSFCTERLVNDLRLEGQAERLHISTLERSAHVEVPAVSMNITDVSCENVVSLEKVYAVHELPITQENGVAPEDVSKWPHLHDIELADCTAVSRVDILIGQDAPSALVPLDARSGGPRAPYAVKTVFGWVVQGPVGSKQQVAATVNFVKGDTLQQSLDKFWKLDSDENLADDTKGLSVEDKQAISVMKETISHVDGHYEMAIPFKSRHVKLPDNKVAAEIRLNGLSKKFSRDSSLHEKYSDNMEQLFVKGHASKVPDEELERSDGKVWYLPHHAVISSKKPNKVRIVFDCAARFNGTSLNDQVLSGPDLTSQLMGVLFRFRQEPIAVMADIEGMFHQVRVRPDQRDVLRFLWWPQGNMSYEPEIYRMNVHLFGGTWSPSCCNYALRRVGIDHKEEFSSETVNTVTRNFYVDDCLKSVENEAKAIELVQELTSLLNKGGFRLTKFTSNSARVLESIPQNDRSLNARNVDFRCDGSTTTEKALGMAWNICDDSIVFHVCQKPVPLTKRGLLSKTCSVYDPPGFLCPYTLKAKKLIQELTRRKADWDEPLRESEIAEWSRWIVGYTEIAKISIPRCLKPSEMKSKPITYELHHFADASCAAYGSVSYVRTLGMSGEINCALLTAKSRLAPIKTMTIPRLELMAAVLAVKVDHMVKRELDIKFEQTIFWTDSTIVLQYIRSKSQRFHTFVENRLTLIHDATLPVQWRYVPTKENPADDASRGLNADELVHRDRWWNGPTFLHRPKDDWPPQPDGLGELTESDPEVKKSSLFVNVFNTLTLDNLESIRVTDSLLCRRSNWMKLKQDVAWFLRFVRYMKNKVNLQVEVKAGPLHVSDLQSAETAIFQYVQRQNFGTEIEDLAKTSGRVKKGSPLIKLDPLMTSDGVICVGGRLKNARISTQAKHPVILPKCHPVTDLIIRHVHETSAHSGREHVLSLLRLKYWIVRGRVAVRRVLRDCVSCRRIRARHGEQKMADLPADRVSGEKPPFTYVGVDLFGPFLIKQRRCTMKRYGCIFTCLQIRAVHIEIVHSLDVDSFINALQRFISRRGRPAEVRSDNGTNFKAGDRELKEAVQKWNSTAKLSKSLIQHDIQWKYNPPAASHMGGVWERQIRSVRKVLNSLLREQSLNEESLTTVMCQAELIINSRPITAVSDDIDDLEALTPLSLLTLHRDPVLPAGIFQKEDNYCRRRWKQVQYIADVFWKRWKREYLPLLQARTKWCTATRDFKPGDIVLLFEDTPRSCWPLARITGVHTSPDGHVRSVTLKTRGAECVRPVTKICFLESGTIDTGT